MGRHGLAQCTGAGIGEGQWGRIPGEGTIGQIKFRYPAQGTIGQLKGRAPGLSNTHYRETKE
jgi:hypothetical protein